MVVEFSDPIKPKHMVNSDDCWSESRFYLLSSYSFSFNWVVILEQYGKSNTRCWSTSQRINASTRQFYETCQQTDVPTNQQQWPEPSDFELLFAPPSLFGMACNFPQMLAHRSTTQILHIALTVGEYRESLFQCTYRQCQVSPDQGGVVHSGSIAKFTF